ncbi:LuxR C-terminal-related transcriptional regulator [Actinosynnema sp. NPDC023587]|uniref:helix-turn-helix transcriptional regulator n=1 Tax=Actinosynnema sp. NPDC023587 TaxID=3154695 RepID=UPI0033F9159F
MTTLETAVHVRVVAADPFLRAGLEAALSTAPGLALAPGGITVLASDDIDGDALRAIESAEGAVVLVTRQRDAAAAVRALGAGACAVLHRDRTGPDTLVAAVRAAATGHGTLPPGLLDDLVRMRAETPSLDPREQAVLRMVADGHETAEIATALSYSSRTVSAIVHDITHRLRLKNRAHAVAYALRQGLI